MESIPLEVDDIFGDEDDVEDFSPSRLPDLEDELEPMRHSRDNDDNNEAGNGEEETDNAELMAKLKSMKGASKNVAKKSIPKLDAMRLTGERGIPILPTAFQDIQLKGKNHEKEDLKTIMQNLELWAHRLFPKMTFSEVLDRVERLGAKKEVQNCVKRIRLGMPVLVTDNLQDEDDVLRTEPGGEQVPRTEPEEEDAQRSEESSHENEIDDNEIEELLREQMLPVSSLNQPDDAASHSKAKTEVQQKNDISVNLKAKIEQNKKLAMERRAAKLKLAEESKGDSPDTATHCDQPQTSTMIDPSSSKDESTKEMLFTDSESMIVDNTLSDNDVSSMPEADAPEDSGKEQTSCAQPETILHNEKLFDEDSDSEMLYMADV